MKFSLLTLTLLTACSYHDGKKSYGDKVATSPLPFPTGLYQLTHDVGTLTISSATQKSFGFSLRTEGEKSCEVAGEAIVNANRADYGASDCKIQFAGNSTDGVLVESDCAARCKTGADLDGFYTDFGGTCDVENIKKGHESFNAKVAAQEFVAAINSLSPLLSKCDGPLNRHRTERARMRNDLAHAAFKAGDAKRCQGFLKQIDDSQDLRPEAYSSFWSKEALEEIKKISVEVNATRKLCQK